jgi:hypothetical protein
MVPAAFLCFPRIVRGKWPSAIHAMAARMNRDGSKRDLSSGFRCLASAESAKTNPLRASRAMSRGLATDLELHKRSQNHQQRCGFLARSVAFAAPSPARHGDCFEAIAIAAPRFLSHGKMWERKEIEKCKNKPIPRSGVESRKYAILLKNHANTDRGLGRKRLPLTNEEARPMSRPFH